LGEQYIGLEAGGDPDILEANDKIIQTQDAVVLEKLISQFLYNQASKEEE
jgi:phospholipid/cholesterol/gamma-HCH transport system substrate-binding protein